MTTICTDHFSEDYFLHNQKTLDDYNALDKKQVSTFGVRNNRFVLITTSNSLLQRIWNAFLSFIGIIKTDKQSLFLLQDFTHHIPSLHFEIAKLDLENQNNILSIKNHEQSSKQQEEIMFSMNREALAREDLIEQLNTDKQGLLEQLSQSQKEIKELKREIDDLHYNIEHQAKMITHSEELEAEIDRLNQENEALIADKIVIEDLEDKKESLQKLTELEENLEKITSENEAYKQKISELEGSVTALKDNGANSIARHLPHLLRNAQLLEIFLQSMNRKPKEAGKPTMMGEALAAMRNNKKYSEDYNSLFDYVNKLGPSI